MAIRRGTTRLALLIFMHMAWRLRLDWIERSLPSLHVVKPGSLDCSFQLADIAAGREVVGGSGWPWGVRVKCQELARPRSFGKGQTGGNQGSGFPLAKKYNQSRLGQGPCRSPLYQTRLSLPTVPRRKVLYAAKEHLDRPGAKR